MVFLSFFYLKADYEILAKGLLYFEKQAFVIPKNNRSILKALQTQRAFTDSFT